jgi:hypothetical protein
MKVVSADSSCSVVWLGAACAEVSPGSVEASKAKHGLKVHMEPQGPRHIRKNKNTIIIIACHVITILQTYTRQQKAFNATKLEAQQAITSMTIMVPREPVLENPV